MITSVLQIAVLALGLLVVYPYTIYPFALWLLSKFRPRPWRKSDNFLPRLSVIIAAHNEEAVIEGKLDNTLRFDYPEDLLEIIVVSDGSTDRTNELVRSYGGPVHLIELGNQSGKQVALNEAVAESTGEVLFFTDAAVFLDAQAAREVVGNFADPKVGAVSSVIQICDNPATHEAKASDHPEGTYLNLDLAVRRLESFVGSAVGCCGSCYAVRRGCFLNFDPGACNDFASALDVAHRGYRVVMDDAVVGRMTPAKTVQNEFSRKVRTIAGGLDTLWRSRVMFSGRSGLLFLWSLASHKIARWLGPLAMSLAVVLSGVGAAMGDPWLIAAFALAMVPISLGGLTLLMPSALNRFFLARMASFALIAWWATVKAWSKFLRGERQVTWKPTVRHQKKETCPPLVAHHADQVSV